VLVIVASPGNYEPLNVEHEWQKLRGAVADLESRGLIALERMEDATLAALQRRLRGGPYHMLHFIGHGVFDERAGEGALIFEDEQGRGVAVRGTRLATILHDHDPLRLVILNSCDGARTAPADPFGGVAQCLLRQGIPAVIAMQFQVSDDAAIVFAHEFYGAIADGYPVDAALVESRKAMFAHGHSVEWGTPVLHLHAPDGVIFDIAPGSARESSPSAASQADPARESSPPRPVRRVSRGAVLAGGLLSVIALLLLGWWLWPQPAAIECRALADLELYNGPGAGYTSRGTVTHNANVSVLGRSPSGLWVQVRDSGGRTGWLEAARVGCASGPAQLPVISDQPELNLPAAAAEPAPSNDAVAGNVTYSVIEVEVDIDNDGTRAVAGERLVRIRVRVTNNGSDAADVGRRTCRLIVAGVPRESERPWAETLPAGDSTEGTLLFSVPQDATAAELQVGEPSGETSTIAISIDLSTR
jgi:uncharacterized protein YraI